MGTGIAAHFAGAIAHTARMGASGFAAGAGTVLVNVGQHQATVGAPAASIPLLPCVGFPDTADGADDYSVFCCPRWMAAFGFAADTGIDTISKPMLWEIYAAVGAFTAQILLYKIVFLWCFAIIAQAVFNAGIPPGMCAFAITNRADTIYVAMKLFSMTTGTTMRFVIHILKPCMTFFVALAATCINDAKVENGRAISRNDYFLIRPANTGLYLPAEAGHGLPNKVI